MKRRELMQYTLAAPATFLGKATLCTASTPKPPKEEGAVPDAHLTAPLSVPASGEIRVAFLISSDAEVIDFAGPWAVFEYVMIGDDNHNPFKLYTVAASKDPIKVSFGMTVVPNYTYADAPTPDVVVVPAMDTDKLTPATFDWLRSVHNSTAVTLSICNGSFVLGAAGLLDGKKATSHHSGYGMFAATYPKVTVIRGVRYTEDGRISTSGGLTSGMDLALRVVERYYGRDVAHLTAQNLEYQSTGWMFPASNIAFAKRPVSTAQHPYCQVCEMQVSPKLTWQYETRTYYFCSESHKKRFMASPDRYIDPA